MRTEGEPERARGGGGELSRGAFVLRGAGTLAVVSGLFAAAPWRGPADDTLPLALPDPPIFNGDFSTGDAGQWRATGPNGGLQDSTTHENTNSAWFGPLNFLKDQPGLPGWWGQFNVPAQASLKQRCQVITQSSPVRHDVDEYITLRVYVPPGWTDGSPQWPVQLIEPNFQGLGPNGVNQFTLVLKKTYIGVEVHSGIAHDAPNPYWYEYMSDPTNHGTGNVPVMYAIPKGAFRLGTAYELIVHIRWAFDRTGQIETWYRTFGTTAWTRSVSQSGFPTLQTFPDGSYDADNRGDVLQVYRGPSASPTQVWMNGYTVCDSFDSADAQLG